MALSNPLLQAVRRYGPSVQGIAHQYGISGEALLAKLIQGESGGSATATSKAGAKGYTQFMPGTRRISIDRYGIDPLAGPDAAVHAAALHLRGKLTGAKGLQGYNPGGGQGYVDYILGQHVGDVGGRSGSGSSGGDSGGLATALTGSVTPGQVTGGGFDPGSPSVSSLADLLGSRPQPVAPQLPAAPFSSSKYLHLGNSPVVTQSQPEASGSGIDSLLAQMQGGGQEIPQTSVSAAQTSVSGSAPTAHASSASPSGGKTAKFDGKTVVAWMVPALQYAREHGWKGQVISGVRSHALQSQLYNDFKAGRRHGPVAVPGHSNHEIQNGGAVDVSDPNTLARIMAGYSGRKLRQGTAIGDPPHFSASGR